MDAFVFDTGPLAHFARVGHLDVLKSLTGSSRVLIPVQVASELRIAARNDPAVRAILNADWI